MTTPDKTRSRASELMPELLADLERLVAIPSVAFLRARRRSASPPSTDTCCAATPTAGSHGYESASFGWAS